MSHTPKLTMIGLYNYYDDVFINLNLPGGVDKQTVIDTFLLEHGESPLLYSNGDFVKTIIGIWSRKWYHSIDRLINTMADEYNPLYNFDRNEVYTDIEKILNEKSTDSTSKVDSKTKDEYSGTEDTTTNGTTENTVSAYNANTYQPDTKQINSQTNNVKSDNERNITGNTKADENIKEDGKTDRELEHTAHLYGNIGVTTSQQMLEAEVDLRMKINIYSLISELLYRELCVYTY